MGDFETYYRNLAMWETKPIAELIAPWKESLVNEIALEFRSAFRAFDFQSNPLLVDISMTNQSVGNKFADFLVTSLNQYLNASWIEDCTGASYPDKCLVRKGANERLAFELKATSHFDPNDSNVCNT